MQKKFGPRRGTLPISLGNDHIPKKHFAPSQRKPHIRGRLSSILCAKVFTLKRSILSFRHSLFSFFILFHLFLSFLLSCFFIFVFVVSSFLFFFFLFLFSLFCCVFLFFHLFLFSFFHFSFSFSFSFLGCSKSVFLPQFASRFLVTFFQKKKSFF